MKFCKNCSWCDYRPPNYKARVIAKYFCNQPHIQILDMVSGERIPQSCQQVRQGKCGKDAKLFVQVDPMQPFSIWKWIKS